MSTKAAELLRALNSQISHQPAPLSTVPQELPQQPPKQSGLTSIILEQKLPQPTFEGKIRYDEGSQAPQCLTEILVKLMNANEKLFQSVESLLRQREKNAYDGFIGDDKGFVEVMLEQAKRQQNPYLDVVAAMIEKRKSKVEGDLQHGKIHVQVERKLSNRRQVEYLQKLDVARMIQIKDGELRSKMDVLHRKLEDFQNLSAVEPSPSVDEEELHRKVMENIDAQTYSLHSERTKIAKQYVRHMQLQRRSFEERRNERQARHEQQQTERQADLKEAEQMRDIAKHQEILQKIQSNRKRRQEQEKELEAKEEQARKVLAEYHRKLPIFKLKEKEFQDKIIKPAERYREEKLNEIRNNRRAMSLQQIHQHEQKYLSKLQISQAKREQEFKLILKTRQPGMRKRYYKGSAHARIQKMTKEDVIRSFQSQEASKMKIQRMREYNKVVLKQHPPVIDQEKRKELLKSVEEDLMRKKHAKKIFKQVQDEETKQIRFEEYYQELPVKDLKQEGNKFFQEAKKHMKKKEKETALQKIEQLEQQDKQKEEQAKSKAKLLDNLADDNKKVRNLWQIRGKQLEEFANIEVADALKFQFVKHNIQNLDGKAAQKETLMKSIDAPLDVQMKQKGMLQDFYLQSIKQKIKLLE